MQILVLVEHDNQKIHPSTRSVLTAAKQFGGTIALLVVGYQCQSVAEEAATYGSVSTVYCADAACYEHQLAENVSELVVDLARSYQFILASSSTFGKNILPRVAALLDVAQVSDVIKIIDMQTFSHPIYAGNAIETVKVLDETKVLTIRATAFNKLDEKQAPCPIETINKVIPLDGISFAEKKYNQSKRPELTEANIIVSGGRGLQNQENFKLIESLADALGAAIGASRAAVDAGFVPNDYQVGQTGKVVAPELYIAIGISGAIQHLAGMKDSKIIVAINKDSEAPIMQIANYALVGDLFALVPEWIEKMKSI